jgi:O-antigen/teichoic acid export membrane protein
MRRFLALSFVQRGFMFAVYMPATMILARLLTPAEIGVFSMTAAFTSIASAIREFGMSEYIMQERELDRSRVRAVYGVAIVMGLAMGSLVLLLGPVLAAAYGAVEIRQIAIVLALNFALLPFATPSMAMMCRELEFGKVWGVQLACAVTQFSVSIYLAWKGMGPISLAWGSVASSICTVVLANTVRSAEIRLFPTLVGSRAMWAYGLKFALASSLDYATRNIHEFVLPRAFGFSALGLYNKAVGLLDLFNQNVKGAISFVLQPMFAQQARSGSAEVSARYGTALSNFTGVAWPFFAFVGVASPEIVLVLFGEQWLSAAPLLRLMCIAGVVQTGFAFACELLASTGQIGSRLRIVSVTGPAWVALCIFGSTVSIEAVALFTAGPAFLGLVLYSRKVRALIGFSLRDLFASTKKSALVAGFVALALALFEFTLQGTLQSNVFRLMGLSAVAAVAWLVAIVGVRHSFSVELRNLALHLVRITREIRARSPRLPR